MTAKTTDEQAESARAERPVEERAEEIVERVSEQVTRFARRLVARTREEIEDIVAEAQSIRRGE
jgi:DNA-directed RNA polymerase specialized sigma24 family protein